MESVTPEQPVIPQEVIPEQKPPVNKMIFVGAGVGILLVLLLVGFFVFKSFYKPSEQVPPSDITNSTPTSTVMTSPQASPTSVAAPTTQAGGSDAVLDQQSQAIGNELNALDSDASNVDQGLSDQQIDIQ